MRDPDNGLFNVKTVSRLSQNVVPTDEQRKAAGEWLNLLENNQLEDETKNYLNFTSIVADRILGYSINQIHFENNNVEFQYSDSRGKKVVCFETKGTSTNDLFASQHREKREYESPISQAWHYIGKNDLIYGICTNYRNFILLDRRKGGYTKYHFFDFQDIQDNIDKLKEFIAFFFKKKYCRR